MSDLIEKLRRYGEATSRASQLLAEAKGPGYQHLPVEQTVEWQAADTIATQAAKIATLRAAVERLMREAVNILRIRGRHVTAEEIAPLRSAEIAVNTALSTPSPLLEEVRKLLGAWKSFANEADPGESCRKQDEVEEAAVRVRALIGEP